MNALSLNVNTFRRRNWVRPNTAQFNMTMHSRNVLVGWG
jgi:hypothetical protein